MPDSLSSTSPATATPAPAPSIGVAPLPISASATAAPEFAPLAPGAQSSEFLLALIVLGAVLAALWAGRLDGTQATALIGLIVSAYPALRTWLKARHLDLLVDFAAEEGARADAARKTLVNDPALSGSGVQPQPGR